MEIPRAIIFGDQFEQQRVSVEEVFAPPRVKKPFSFVATKKRVWVLVQVCLDYFVLCPADVESNPSWRNLRWEGMRAAQYDSRRQKRGRPHGSMAHFSGPSSCWESLELLSGPHYALAYLQVAFHVLSYRDAICLLAQSNLLKSELMRLILFFMGATWFFICCDLDFQCFREKRLQRKCFDSPQNTWSEQLIFFAAGLHAEYA